MNSFRLSVLALLILFVFVCGSSAQDAELGGRAPLPELGMGEPHRKLSWREKREKTRGANESRHEGNVYRRQAEDVDRATLRQRLSAVASQPKKKVPQEVTVSSSLPENEDGITASGSRLRAFGDDNYWGAVPPPTPEESLID